MNKKDELDNWKVISFIFGGVVITVGSSNKKDSLTDLFDKVTELIDRAEGIGSKIPMVRVDHGNEVT